MPSVRPGDYTPVLDRGVVVSADYVASHLEDAGTRIIDARDARFYGGDETRQGRNGHLPGAVSIPYSSLFEEDTRYKDLAELRDLFTGAGVVPGAKVVTYCHIGQQATAVWFVARLLGYEAALYDGSFQEWAKRTDLPVVTPAPGGEAPGR